jgi:hypothetical protein
MRGCAVRRFRDQLTTGPYETISGLDLDAVRFYDSMIGLSDGWTRKSMPSS